MFPLLRFPRLALAGILATGVAAQENLADLDAFREGCQALVDERFGTAADHFRACWRVVGEGEGGGPEENFVASRLLEALVRDGASSEAIAWLARHPAFQPSPATSYWIAVALQTEGRFAEAADHYQLHLVSAPSPPLPTIIDCAVCLAGSGQASAAYDLVREISPRTAEQTLRLAQIAAAAAHPGEALSLLKTFDPSTEEWKSLRIPATRLRASLLADRGDRAGALDALSKAVETSPDAASARCALILLEVFLDGERPKEAITRLEAWAEDPAFPGREAARLFLHLLLGKDDASRSESLRAAAPTLTEPDLRAETLLRLGELVPSPELPPDLQARHGFSLARADYLANRFAEAARRFEEMAAGDTGEAAERDLFNSATAWLRKGELDAFATVEETLERRNPRSRLLAQLGYLGGLHLAAQGDPGAFERLERFARTHPDSPSQIDARLALAEIHLNQAPARPEEAKEIFESLRTRPLSLAQSERLDYGAVWVELIDRNGPELVRRAEEFVSNWPNSPLLAEVLLILASERHARGQDDLSTAAFHRVAEEFPDSPLAAAARFFEAKTSPPNEDTIEKWRAIIAAQGEFVVEAAHELGLLLLSLDRFQESRETFEGLLNTLAPDSPMRFAAMADLAYADYLEALAADKDAVILARSADRFAALSNLPAAPALWRYNAAVRRGKCLEALGKPGVALEIYRSIVEETRGAEGSPSDALPPEETEWLFRAGFAAIDILNAESNWRGAIEIADALSEKSGPRAIEAARLAEKLRLKHWVWD